MLNCPSCIYFLLLLFISMNIKQGVRSEHVASISRSWRLSWFLKPLMLQLKKNFQQFSGNHYVVAPMWSQVGTLNHRAHIHPSMHPQAWFLGRDLDRVPLMGWVFHWLKLSPTAAFSVQIWASSSEEEGKQLLLWCALQTPPTIRIMFSSSCFDTLLMAIICCPHKYDGLLKDPQDAA